MKILNAGCPRADGFYMPAEYAPHKAPSSSGRSARAHGFTVPSGQERLLRR